MEKAMGAMPTISSKARTLARRVAIETSPLVCGSAAALLIAATIFGDCGDKEADDVAEPQGYDTGIKIWQPTEPEPQSIPIPQLQPQPSKEIHKLQREPNCNNPFRCYEPDPNADQDA